MTFAVENGVFAYGGGRRVLDGISFSVSAGELLAILGPNGAGKTTLLRCMMGFLKWRAGRSTLDGRDIRTYTPDRLWRRMAYVPQARKAAVSFTVGELVLLGRGSRFSLFSQPSREDVRKAEEALDRLRLSHLAGRKCAELSGGELQMALIARALATEPELLILDEPESNLDFRNQLVVLDTMTELARDGVTCIFNTHYPAHALRMAGRSLLLRGDGRAECGDSRDIITERSLREAFGVEAVIGEVETPHNIYYDVLPIRAAEPAPASEIQPKKQKEESTMETRIAIIGIIVEDRTAAEKINELLHEHASYVVGRMGMPYPKKDISIISVIVDAPEDVIAKLSGKLGMLHGVSIKTTYSRH